MSGLFGDDEDNATEKLKRAGARRLLFDPSPLGGEPGTLIETHQAHRPPFDPRPLAGEPGRFAPPVAKPGRIKSTPRKRREPSEDPAGQGPGSIGWGSLGW